MRNELCQGPKIRFKFCPRIGGILACPADPRRSSSFKSCPRIGGISNYAQKLYLKSVQNRQFFCLFIIFCLYTVF